MSGELTIQRRRLRRSRAQAEQLAAEFETSGLTRREFCQSHGIAINTLARYLTRRRRQQSPSTPQTWVAVEVTEAQAAGSGLTVQLSCGYRIEVARGFDPETLRRLVSTLEQV